MAVAAICAFGVSGFVEADGNTASPPDIAAQCATPARLWLAEPELPSREVPATLQLAFLASLVPHPSCGAVGFG